MIELTENVDIYPELNLSPNKSIQTNTNVAFVLTGEVQKEVKKIFYFEFPSLQISITLEIRFLVLSL